MIIKSWHGVSPVGVLQTDLYIPISLEFPLDSVQGRPRIRCFYKSIESERLLPGGHVAQKATMLELVVEEGSGLLCRLVLVGGVVRARYEDFDPEPIAVVGDPVFDVDLTCGARLNQRDRKMSGIPEYRSVDQFERFEALFGDQRVSFLFEGRSIETAVRVGDHLFVLLDSDREVTGFQFTGFTDEQWDQMIEANVERGMIFD